MTTANWSELPNDILGHLIGFLPLPDYHRFGVVCKNWCTVARENHHHPAQQLPWLVMGEDIATSKRIFFNLSENKHYYMDLPELHNQFVCGSSFGWLFTVDIALNIRMLNPFTRERYNLPCPNFRHKVIHKKFQPRELVYKIILDHDPNERSDFTVMLIGCCTYKEIAFWRHGDPTWTLPLFPYNIYHYIVVKDIIFFKGKFYALVRHYFADQFFVVDVGPDSKLIPLQHQTPDPMIQNFYKCLVDFNGELLLIQWDRGEEEVYIVDTINVVVHKLDFEEGTYYEVKHINNHAFFIGNNSPVVIDAAQFSDAIYFTQRISDYYQMGWYKLETYNMVTKKLVRYYRFAKFNPGLFFRPTWLALKT